MRTLVLALLASLSVTLVSAEHVPEARCYPDSSLPASGVVQISVDGDTYYLIDDADGDAMGPHVYEETNGIHAEDLAHALQQEEVDEGDHHPDLPAGCEDPLVVPDTHVW